MKKIIINMEIKHFNAREYNNNNYRNVNNNINNYILLDAFSLY